jgi:hypothetical protein
MRRNTLSLLFVAWLMGGLVVDRANAPAMVILTDAGLARHLPTAVTTVASQPQRMDTGNREAQALSGLGTLIGRVTMGPMFPVGRSGDPDAPAAVPGARIVISSMDGQEIASAVTDKAGGYRVPLPPGSYRIDMPPLASGGFTKDLPVTVTIATGQETRLDIRIDTGIR